ncbi:hypothetical protein MED222_06150 [Vibrio sp. MED222]|nr:hypothetical protein MED222_06150 [Vibrio sp. MED222]
MVHLFYSLCVTCSKRVSENKTRSNRLPLSSIIRQFWLLLIPPLRLTSC